MLKKLLNLLSDSAIYGLSDVIAQLVGFLLLPLYTRYLTPYDYGILAMLMVFNLFFRPVANLGISNAIFRFISQTKDEVERRKILSTGFVAVSISCFVLLLTCEALSYPLTQVLVRDIRAVHLLQLVVLSAVVAAIGVVPETLLRVERRVKTVAGLDITQLIVAISLTIWFVVGLRMSIFGVVLASLISDALITTIAFTVTRRSFAFRLDVLILKRMLSYGLPFLPYTLQVVGLLLFGQYMLNHLVGLEKAGIYSIALRFAAPIALVVGAVQQAWSPFKFQIHAQDKDPQAFFRSAVTYYSAGILYLWVGISAWGPEMVRWMTPPSFHGAAHLVSAVALILVLRGMYYMLGTGAEMSNRTKVMPLISFVGLVTVIIGAYTLIPLWNAMGAALATAAGWLMMVIGIYTVAQRRYAVRYEWRLLNAIFITTLIFVGTAYLWQSLMRPSRLLLAFAVSVSYPIIIFFLFLNSQTERHRMLILKSKLGQFLYRSRTGTLRVHEPSKVEEN